MSLLQSRGFLFISLQPSRCLAIWIIASHSIAALGLLVSPWRWWIDLLLFIVICGSAIWLLRLHVWRTSAKSVVSIQQNHNGWLLTLRDETLLNGTLHFDSLVMTKLVVLNFKVPGRLRPLPVIIVADAINAEQLRLLRVVLRWSSSEETPNLF
ncbi:protein YgfX [Zooshikella sp. RANM57]|uniref:protein YgfX n=1 Tax=Zooshikella sp. RANM57 TaxID=3425863 RepID=UPI003D6E5267